MSENELKSKVDKVVELHRSGEELSFTSVDILLFYIDSLEYKLLVAKRTIEELHGKYGHEGGIPQVMTKDILTKWIRAIDVPIMTDVYQISAPNVFYATFALPLSSEHKAQITALGFEVIYPDSPLRNRYMLKWQTPKNDEV